MSSRNLLLSPKERLSAPLISKTLKDLVSQKHTSNVQKMKQLFIETINKDPHLQTEYIEIVNDNTLLSVDKIVPGSTSVCVAVYCGKIRLIDNMQFE
jgi:pantoate--beta-alanine ligase